MKTCKSCGSTRILHSGGGFNPGGVLLAVFLTFLSKLVGGGVVTNGCGMFEKDKYRCLDCGVTWEE